MNSITERDWKTYCDVRANVVARQLVLALPLSVIFIVLKLFGALDWSWWWVTLPLWGGGAYLAAACASIGFYSLVVYK